MKNRLNLLKDIPWLHVVLIAGFVSLLVVLVNRLKSWSPFGNDIPDGGQQIKPSNLPNPDSHYKALAEQVEFAIRGPGTDEEQLEQIFKGKTVDEIRAINYYYGERLGQFALAGKRNMVYWLKDDLKDSPYWYDRVGALLIPAAIGW